jgi:hypothetical protein
MEQGTNTWVILLKKYLRKEITPEEKDKLECEMKACPIKQQQLKEINDHEALINELSEMNTIDVTKAWEDLEPKLLFPLQPPDTPASTLQ